MAHALWMLHNTKATDTHSEYVILTVFFHGKNGYCNALQYYIYEKTRKKM